MSEADEYMERLEAARLRKEGSRWLRERLARGLSPMGPGAPLLPPAYRGSADYIAGFIVHAVLHLGVPIATFYSDLDAQHWVAWWCAERNERREDFTVHRVRQMSKRLTGPLFDDALPGPVGIAATEEEPS